jgi:hypothetical protein
VYWTVRGLAEHRLGGHRDELRTARRARELHLLQHVVAEMEVSALAALGRRRELDDLLQREQQPHPAPHALLRIGSETRAPDQ